MLAMVTVISGLDRDLRVYFQAHSWGYQQEAAVPHHMGLLTQQQCPHASAAGFSQQVMQEKEGGEAVITQH